MALALVLTLRTGTGACNCKQNGSLPASWQLWFVIWAIPLGIGIGFGVVKYVYVWQVEVEQGQ
jgi:hypothetical protein